MQELFSLGELYVSDFLRLDEEPRTGKYELKLVLDDDGAARLEKMAPHNTMWGERYWYRSSTNETMRNALKDVVESIINIVKLEEKNLWIDLASNDLTLLGFVPKNLIRVGIDPVKDESFLINKNINTDLVIQDYFSAEVFKKSKFGHLKPKIISCIAMFYDIEENNKFLQDIYEILDTNGVFVLQFSYSPLMISQLAFDNLCHEHCYYYSLFNLKKLFDRNGFKIMDCTLNDINSGSARLFLMKKHGNEQLFATQPFRDVAKFRVDSLLEYEKILKLDCVETWQKFYMDINSLRDQVVGFIKTEKSNGKLFFGLGASTKGSTLGQYFQLGPLIEAIVERSPPKFGLRTVGTNIPIISEQQFEEYFEKDNSLFEKSYLFVFPWHFVSEFKKRYSWFLERGGKMILPCPKFEII